MNVVDKRARARPPAGVELTTVAEKLDWYAFDPYFRDGCDDVRAVREAVGEVDLWNHTFLVFRPDAVVTRGLSRGIEVLQENGFSILELHEFQYTYLTVREGWRYQNNINTTDRLMAMDLLMTATPSLLCLLGTRHGDVTLPASARIKALKGPSAPERRRPGQLRYEMGGTPASMFSLVHAPDEPADLLRELAIFLDPPRRRRAYRLLAGQPASLTRQDIETAVADLYARTPVHDLQATTVLEGLRRRGRIAHSLLAEIERGDQRDLPATLALLGMDPQFGPLDAVAIASRITTGHIAGCDPVLPDVDPFAWKTRLSRAVPSSATGRADAMQPIPE